MRVAEAFREPQPIPIRIPSRATSEKFAAALALAVAERRYANPSGFPGWLRLRGSVSGNDVRLTIKTYFLPGIRSRGNIDKLVVGSIRETLTGSELVGLVSAPIARSTVLLLGGLLAIFATILAAIVVSIAVSTSSGASDIRSLLVATAAAAFMVGTPAVLWPLMVRQAQRVNLNEVGPVTQFLQSFADESKA